MSNGHNLSNVSTCVLIAHPDEQMAAEYDAILNGTSAPDFGGAVCDVHHCHSADEVLATCAQAIDQAGPFPLVIVDEALVPNGGFSNIVDELKELDPRVNIVRVGSRVPSSDDGAAAPESHRSHVHYWEKPIRPLEVRQIVRTLIEKRVTEQGLEVARSRVQQILSASPIVVYSCDPDDFPLLNYVSENVLDHFGYAANEFLNDSSFWIDRIHPGDRGQVLRYLDRLMDLRSLSVEYRFRDAKGHYRWINDQVRLMVDDMDRPKEIVGCWMDVTERRNTEDRIRYLAYFDDLTGLPNRSFLRELLDHSIAGAERHNRQLAVMFMDIDHFKRVNDTLGHEAGDTLLRELAKRLSHCVRSCDAVSRNDAGALPDSLRSQQETNDEQAVSRLGGDEFVVVLSEITGPDDAAAAAKRIAQALSAPIKLPRDEITITLSIGISMFPTHGDKAEDLLKKSDMALYKAKENGRNTFFFFNEDMNKEAKRRFSVESRLRNAVQRNEFVLHYQPILDIRDHRIVAVEALIRWRQPDDGLIAPMEFIPIAEETGLIVPIDQWVYHEACRQVAEWNASGLPPMRVSVNVSPVHFREGVLAASITEALRNNALDPRYFQIELTESLLISDTQTCIRILGDIKSIGAQICVDDFGTGYSSLAYLKKFPLNCLKVPRCFVRDLTTDIHDAAIVSATVALAHNLGLRTVAEGVEEVDQLALLKSQGCDEAQGYFFTPPLPPSAFIDWLQDWMRHHPLEPSKSDSQVIALAE